MPYCCFRTRHFSQWSISSATERLVRIQTFSEPPLGTELLQAIEDLKSAARTPIQELALLSEITAPIGIGVYARGIDIHVLAQGSGDASTLDVKKERNVHYRYS